jgi:hypothetical protein
MAGFSSTLFRFATAPAKFALRQTRTNIDTLRALRSDYAAWESILEQATGETVENMMRVLVAAENSLPSNLEDMTPNERQRELANSLARSEQHLLAAFGELYRSFRLATIEAPMVIDNPPQEQLEQT